MSNTASSLLAAAAAGTLSSVATSELVAFYNAHAAKPVSKFSDRKTAERRVLALAEEVAARAPAKPAAKSAAKAEKAPAKPAAKSAAKAEKAAAKADYVQGTCPSCGAECDQTPAGLEGTSAGDNRNFCHHCGTEYFRSTGRIYNAPVTSASRSTAIAASWNDPTVAAARAERSHVIVKGVEYRSVLQAFQQLGLPISKHIAFRGQLKAAGRLAFNGIVFEIATPNA